MFYKNRTLSVKVDDLVAFISERVEGAINIVPFYDNNSCDIEITFPKDINYDQVKSSIKEAFNFEIKDLDDLNDLEDMGNDKGIEISLSLNEFKGIIEKYQNVELSGTCLVDETNEVIYFFY